MENFNQYCLERVLVDNNNNNLKELNFLIKKLDNCFKRENENFAETCFVVYRIKKLFDDYKQVYVYSNMNVIYNFDMIMTGFGISQSESSKLLSIYDKFCCLSCSDLTVAKCSIMEEFKGFSKSKLAELLQVENTQIINDLRNKVLRYDMTVTSIRQYVKNYKTMQKSNKNLDKEEEVQEEIREEDIPEAYDPTKYYEFQYFEEKTKSQLLNIVWDLQKEYQRLKKKH